MFGNCDAGTETMSRSGITAEIWSNNTLQRTRGGTFGKAQWVTSERLACLRRAATMPHDAKRER